MRRRILSLTLALCIIFSCIFVTNFASLSTSAGEADVTSVSASTGPQQDIEGSAILHCFNWSYNNIKNNLQAIKDAGYTAVQTSPVQSPKDYNGGWNDQGGQWWKLYQPLDFTISNNTWLGNKNDLKNLCSEAERYGIKVVVDVVANHLANNHEGGGYGNLNGGVASNLKRGDFYHNDIGWANDGSRYQMTMGHIGMPDLNTGHSDVQNIVKGFLIDCINQGVDGFRFDAAKHIELPNDNGCGSNFWPTVINGSQSATSNKIFYYGEILNGCGTDIKNYTQYMSITDNYSSDSILVAANNGNAQGLANSSFSKGAQANKNVLWVESHDTHMGESGSAGISKTSGISDDKIIKAWAMVGSRADATALFFARPNQNMGQASSNTTWKSKTVAEVNKFKNYFDGQSEYLASEGSIAYNERGTSGVVLVNANGSSASVNVRANKMANGTYKDAVSGSTFTVSGGRITGNIGNTGVAVVYNATNNNIVIPGPTPAPTTAPTDAPTVKPTEVTGYKYGDVDLDDTINIVDATNIQRHVSKTNVLTSTSLLTADVNCDSKVDIVDATLVQSYVSGKEVDGSYCGQYMGKQQTTLKGDYVYFKNTQNWDRVTLYYWSDENSNMMAWPGKDMELLSDSVYYAQAPSDIDYVIFSNGGNSQTADLRFEGMNKIYDNGSWSNYGSSNVTPVPPTPVPDNDQSQNTTPQGNYIYFKNNEDWGEVKVYYWSDSNQNMIGWPGIHMENVGNKVYRAEIPADATMVVFNNNNQNRQTSDIRLEGMNKIYDNGSWSNYND